MGASESAGETLTKIKDQYHWTFSGFSDAGRDEAPWDAEAMFTLLGRSAVRPSLERVDSFADTLWRRNQDTAEAALHHPFLRGIASGELPRAAFAHYVGQDAAFLDAYCRAYAFGSAKSPDREGVMVFESLLDAAVEELALHRGYADRWGVDLDPPIDAATAAYTDFILTVAALEPVGHIAAAMAPCLRLYSYLGQQLNPHTRPGNPFREWVTTYSDPEFETLAERLEGLIDRYGGDSERMTFLYGRGMELEMQFFSSCAQ